MEMFDPHNYILPDRNQWKGRNDGTEREFSRWHQVVELINLHDTVDLKNSVVFIGFCCDEGVRRNQGRVGAKEGPGEFRKIMSNLPVHFSTNLSIRDAGDICCFDCDMEGAQYSLAMAVSKIIKAGGFPIVLGGGHEITLGHYAGLRHVVGNESIGVINIDAHLDIRGLISGKGNSGTGFYEISADCKSRNIDFKYLILGAQKISNTQALFNAAEDRGVYIIYDKAFNNDCITSICQQVDTFARQVNHIYLTIDLDAFAAPYTPGVSAPAFNGIIPNDVFWAIYEHLISLPNLRTIDVAELNPRFDVDNRTVRLGSSLIFEAVNKIGLNKIT